MWNVLHSRCNSLLSRCEKRVVFWTARAFGVTTEDSNLTKRNSYSQTLHTGTTKSKNIFKQLSFLPKSVPCYISSSVRADGMAIEPNYQRSLSSDFELDKKSLASGKFGVVRVGHRINPVDGNESRVAVKTVDVIRGGADIKEVDIVNSIDSMKTMSFDTLYLTRGKCHLISPLYEGGDLFDLIVSQPRSHFDENNASLLFRKILHCVRDCHKSGVVHLDIKPENFCLRKPVHADVYNVGEVADLVLIDFGYAIRIDDEESIDNMTNVVLNRSGDSVSSSIKPSMEIKEQKLEEWRLRNVAGSVTYAAPELLDSRYSKASDMWSLGVVLYILLTGQPPWQQDQKYTIHEKQKIIENMNTNLKSNQCEHSQIFSHTSPEAVNLVRQLLSLDPKKRISVEEALSHPFVSRKISEEEEDLISVAA